MNDSIDYNELQKMKLKGSKKFITLWIIIISSASIIIYLESENHWPLIIGGLFLYPLVKYTGDQHRVGLLLTSSFFIGSILGVIFWSWWSIPIVFFTVIIIAQTHGIWITQPLMKEIHKINKSKPDY